MRLFASLVVAAAMMVSCAPSSDKKISQNSDSAGEVAAAVESLRKQLIDPEQNVLEALASEILTYGHSNGHIEGRSEFIESLVSGKFNFETMDLTEQTIDISGETAIVRHRLSGATADVGKEPGTANLKVLQVWQKQGSEWKLLSRQAVKIPMP
jgi:ketosteroid isomerase-like protein